MPALSDSFVLVASPDPALLGAFEPVLAAGGARVEFCLSAEAALSALTALEAPSIALLDARLPGMELGQLLALVHTHAAGRRSPIVLISDTVTQAAIDRLAEGVIHDILPQSIEAGFLAVRLESVLRSYRQARELEALRETAQVNARADRLTGLLNREAMLSILFCETDRAQRWKSSLSIVLFDIDDFSHWNGEFGSAACDQLLCQVAGRGTRLLRSYDLMGRVGNDEFLLALPGCSSINAVMLAERMRTEMFSQLFVAEGTAIRMSACFGVASSMGRSPLVVLREAEQALAAAKAAGPETIECAGSGMRETVAPAGFLSPGSGDELLAW